MRKNFFNRKIKLMITVGICVLFMALVISSTAKRPPKKDEPPYIEFIGFK